MAVMLLIAVPAARASMITVEYVGTITQIDASYSQTVFEKTFAVGDRIRGFYSYDTTTIDYLSLVPSLGEYQDAIKAQGFVLDGAAGTVAVPALGGVDYGGAILIANGAKDSYIATGTFSHLDPTAQAAYTARQEADLRAIIEWLSRWQQSDLTYRIDTSGPTGPYAGILGNIPPALPIAGAGAIPLAVGDAHLLALSVELLENLDGSAFASDALPATLPDPSLFGTRHIKLRYLGEIVDEVLTASLDSISIQSVLTPRELLALYSGGATPGTGGPGGDDLLAPTGPSRPTLQAYLESIRGSVPEPASLILMGTGLLAIGAAARRRRGRNAACHDRRAGAGRGPSHRGNP